MTTEEPEGERTKFVSVADRKHSDEVFRELLDTAPDSVIVVEELGRIAFVNIQTERLFGYARDELLGKEIELLIPERYRSAHVGLRKAFFDAPKVRPMGSGLELFGRRQDGSEFPVEISLSPLPTPEGMLISASIRDVTDRKESEREMRQIQERLLSAVEELRRARAVAEASSSAKSEFLASMSHELRTPLNAILGFAQLLHRDKKTPLSDRHRERIEHVLKGGEHLLRLIDEVLDLSRIEAGRVTVSPEPVGVAEVLAEVKTTLDPMAARSDIELLVQPIEATLPKVVADRTRFKQVLMNYGSNAIKYGRRRGKASIQATEENGRIRVTVADDGIGIREDKRDKLFQPFHRAGQETGPIEGTGIGLAISKRLAELMGGTVGYESVEGHGSKFWIELPAYRPEPDAPHLERRTVEPEPSWLTGPTGPRYLIVYIEDNPSNIAFMEDLIRDFERVELLTAPTAEIGMELIRARLPSAVIMDINLPGMSGFEATRRLREWPETRDIPIVALSAAAMVRDKTRVEEANFYRYLTKPVKVDELTQVLEELLQSADSG